VPGIGPKLAATIAAALGSNLAKDQHADG
jgi:hypothetical protein